MSERVLSLDMDLRACETCTWHGPRTLSHSSPLTRRFSWNETQTRARRPSNRAFAPWNCNFNLPSTFVHAILCPYTTRFVLILLLLLLLLRSIFCAFVLRSSYTVNIRLHVPCAHSLVCEMWKTFVSCLASTLINCCIIIFYRYPTEDNSELFIIFIS